MMFDPWKGIQLLLEVSLSFLTQRQILFFCQLKSIKMSQM